jgi:hypothetical protein
MKWKMPVILPLLSFSLLSAVRGFGQAPTYAAVEISEVTSAAMQEAIRTYPDVQPNRNLSFLRHSITKNRKGNRPNPYAVSLHLPKPDNDHSSAFSMGNFEIWPSVMGFDLPASWLRGNTGNRVIDGLARLIRKWHLYKPKEGQSDDFADLNPFIYR